MENKDKKFLPFKVEVEKNLRNNKSKVIPHKGTLSRMEKRLFASGIRCVELTNCFGEEVNYLEDQKHKAKISKNVPLTHYTYRSYKFAYDDELRLK